jgi:hypothetical protein
MWFEPLLVNNRHFIEVETNELESKVLELIKNDKESERIANNGYKFSKKYINKKRISAYWFYYMLYLNKFTINK